MSHICNQYSSVYQILSKLIACNNSILLSIDIRNVTYVLSCLLVHILYHRRSYIFAIYYIEQCTHCLLIFTDQNIRKLFPTFIIASPSAGFCKIINDLTMYNNIGNRTIVCFTCVVRHIF